MRSSSRVVAVFVAVATVLLAATLAHADWPSSPTTNLPICTAANQQLVPSIATDMSGGAYIIWQDGRVTTDVNIYAQHVLATGVVDPAWPLNGLLVCGATGNQSVPQTENQFGAVLDRALDAQRRSVFEARDLD